MKEVRKSEKNNKRKKVLIITYYWPPAGGPGVQRVLKFIKYLPEFGWDPLVLTVKDGEYPAIDNSLMADIPENCQVYESGTIEFFSLFKRLTGRQQKEKIETYILNRKQVSGKDKVFRWIRQNLFIPDARVGWVPFAIRKGKQIIKAEQPDLIFSSSPPHSLHLAAKALAKWSKLPWVPDFRDPWTDAFWDKHVGRTRLADYYNRKLERGVVKSATALTTVSPYFRDLLRDKFAHPNFQVIHNGFDWDDFNYEPRSQQQFSIVYTGHIAESQNPENLFTALRALPAELRSKVRVDFYGIQDQVVKNSWYRAGLEDMITDHGYVSHSIAVQAMLNADVLLLLIPNENATGTITGKVYEYLAAQNYILGIGPPSGVAAQLIEGCGAGKMYAFHDSLESPIIDMIHQWEQYGAKKWHTTDVEKIQVYSRRELSRSLTTLFNSLLPDLNKVN